MKRVYSKETRDALGGYYRREDWGIDVQDDFDRDDFTDVPLPTEALELDPIAVDWEEGSNSWVYDLASFKTHRITKIDTRTRELLESGFDYNGSHFSMSDAAQRNWAALGAARANGMLTYPITISTSDEGSYLLEDDGDCLGFLTAYMAYQASPTSPLGQGRILKSQIEAATTVAEVQSVVDDR